MAAAAPFVLFAPNSGPGVGGGHVMRCLTLAEALAERGARCIFLVGAEGEAILGRFAGSPFEIVSSGREAAPAALQRLKPDMLVMDDYAATFDHETALTRSVRRLVVIDDLAERRHPADLLLDPGYGRLASDYDGLLPSQAQRLIGPAYALVRPAFAERRRSALLRPITERPLRLLVSFGLGDVGGVTARAVGLARAVFPDVEIDVALGGGAESLPTLRRMASGDERLRLHIDATDVADLMAKADLALGAGGASTWERACLGLPTLAVIVADNQRAMIRRMAAEGLLIGVDLVEDDFEGALTAALIRLIDPDLRRALRGRTSTLCDGGGAARAAEAILAL